MMDRLSKEERSINMSHIKGKDTKPECYIRKLLYAKGLRYRKNYIKIYGKPDIYFCKTKVAVFIHGCYWHRHTGCKLTYYPKTKLEFWNKKFENNIARDKKVQKELENEGIYVLIIWECAVRQMQKNDDIKENQLKTLLDYIKEPTQPMKEIGTL